MARIALVSESIVDNDAGRLSLDLARRLASQQHTVQVFSTFDPDQPLPDDEKNLHLIFPFRRWTMLELPRVIWSLQQFQPEIVHFVDPVGKHKKRKSLLMGTLSTAASVIAGARSVYSFVKSLPDNKRVLPLLQANSLITVPDPFTRQKIQLEFGEETGDRIELLPFFVGADTDNEAMYNEEINFPFSPDDFCIYIPGPVSEWVEPESAIDLVCKLNNSAQKFAFVVGGGWQDFPVKDRHRLLSILDKKDLGGRFWLSGTNVAHDNIRLMQNCNCVLLSEAGADTLTQHCLNAAIQKKPVILSKVQAKRHLFNWKESENALLADENVHSFAEQLNMLAQDKELSRRIADNLHDQLPGFFSDLSGNTLSRMYERILQT